MSYAVRNDGRGFRAVASREDVSKDETFSLTVPVLKPVVPLVITMKQMRLALLDAHLLNKVHAFIAKASEAAQIEWEYGTEVRRDQSLVLDMASDLKLTEAKLDALFINAATL